MGLVSGKDTKLVGTHVSMELSDRIALYTVISGEKRVDLVTRAVIQYLKGQTIEELTDKIAHMALEEWPLYRDKLTMGQYLRKAFRRIRVRHPSLFTYELVCNRVKEVLLSEESIREAQEYYQSDKKS